MGTRGLEVVCFRGRYYIRYHQYDSYYEGLGVEIVQQIPADPEEYQSRLQRNGLPALLCSLGVELIFRVLSDRMACGKARRIRGPRAGA